MPILLFWLTPVFLLIVVILLILQEQQKSKRSLMLVEPLSVLESLEIARIIGEEKIVNEEISIARRLMPEDGSSFELVVTALQPVSAVGRPKATLLEHQALAELCQVIKYEYANRVTSLLIGPLEDVADRADDWSSVEKFRRDSQKALEHGYLPLALARRIDAKLEGGKKRFKIEGLLVCEPIVSDRKNRQLRAIIAAQNFKFVTILPVGVAQSMLQSIIPTDKVIATTTGKLLKSLKPSERQNKLDQALILGEMTLDDCYQASLYFQHRHEVVQVGAMPAATTHLPGRSLSV